MNGASGAARTPVERDHKPTPVDSSEPPRVPVLPDQGRNVRTNNPSDPSAQGIPPVIEPRRRSQPAQEPATIQPAASASRAAHHQDQQRVPTARKAPENIHGTPSTPQQQMPTRPPRRKNKRRRRLVGLMLVLALLLAWPVGLAIWANGKITRVDALSGAPNTPGSTYLLVGSDSRADGQLQDGADGQRSDTIILLNRAPNGQTAMISIPRDTLVEIPGYGDAKINAAYSYGGAPLLVQTVEQLTGLTVDNYLEIGMGGVVSLVDAVGGVNLCYDYDVSDPLSGLEWTAGCATVDGTTALAFARMRHSDPLGDIGRGMRQRQVINAIVQSAATPSLLFNPARQVSLASAGTAAIAADRSTSIIDLARMALAFRAASSADGLSGTPPIADMGYNAGSLGSVVLLADTAPDFFARLQSGDLSPEDFQTY